MINKDHQNANWQTRMSIEPVDDEVEKTTLLRPGHADLVGTQKYGFDDVRPILERSSARETAARVAVGAVARTLLRVLRRSSLLGLEMTFEKELEVPPNTGVHDHEESLG